MEKIGAYTFYIPKPTTAAVKKIPFMMKKPHAMACYVKCALVYGRNQLKTRGLDDIMCKKFKKHQTNTMHALRQATLRTYLRNNRSNRLSLFSTNYEACAQARDVDLISFGSSWNRKRTFVTQSKICFKQVKVCSLLLTP